MVDSMRQALHDAAKVLRRSLVRHGPSPLAFKAALAGVPAEDRDAWLDLLWDIDELPDDDPLLPRGCVPYLPCPVETVLEALHEAAVSSGDVFVDIGAGLGRVAALTHLLTGAACIGLEIQPGLVQAARARAAWLNLCRVRFVEGDAVELTRFIQIGTVFFLYCPFGGDRLHRVLEDLEGIARTRPIRICCVGLPPLDRSWLAPVASTSVDLAVYRSTLHARPPYRSRYESSGEAGSVAEVSRESEVLAVNERFYGAFARQDAEQMSELWAEQDEVSCIHPGWPPIRGRKEVLASWSAIFKHDEPPPIRCESPSVAVHGDAATVMCRERIGNTVLVATNIFVHAGGRWYLAHHHASALAKVPDTPPLDPDLLPN